MIRRIILAAAIAAAVTAPLEAGEIKFHEWPVAFVPQEVTAIPVVMDAGYFILIQNQDELRIKLQQVAIRQYEGCTEMTILSNFNLTLSCQITTTNKVAGEYTCSVSPANLDAPGGTATVCAKLTNANLAQVPGGTRNIHVANVTVKVVPRSF